MQLYNESIITDKKNGTKIMARTENSPSLNGLHKAMRIMEDAGSI